MSLNKIYYFNNAERNFQYFLHDNRPCLSLIIWYAHNLCFYSSCCPLSPGMSGCLPQGQPTQVEFKGDPLNLIGFDWHVLHASVHHWLITCLLNHCWFPLFGRLVTQVWSLQLWESIRKKTISRLDIITKQRKHNRGSTNEEKVQNHDGLNAKRVKSDLE